MVATQPERRTRSMQRRLAALRWILAASIVSTGLHYTHNFVAIEDYPPSDSSIQVAIVVAWPLLTAIGLGGYRLYAAGRMTQAHAFLATYSVTGLSTIAHLAYGVPDVPAAWLATVFTDFLTGAAVLVFVVWSARSAGQRPGAG